MNIEQFQIGDRVRINHHGWAKIVESLERAENT